eukprot:CAMPEP_0183778564 /NCGR_PEP_ID=MMETSP0739-20130205/51739_1 /TAXON_ID=385413 /ORGANISM="Thalassiosira miniscula, Strain CCMP1093" /LENGTH=42 /DNA_ID= /DNA_START= /DNA_END= /DNA_ORIENTATION=
MASTLLPNADDSQISTVPFLKLCLPFIPFPAPAPAPSSSAAA